MPVSHAKQHGIHYTPSELADFLAEAIVEHLPQWRGTLAVLDPACGNGALLSAFSSAISARRRKRVKLVGYETDQSALQAAQDDLAIQDAGQVLLERADFLNLRGVDNECQVPVPDQPQEDDEVPGVDVIIANPPYVRTQVLGTKKAQQLARRFGLRGRVDLYHAFTIAMANALKPGALLGLLTSNRFLTTNSGGTLRKLLHDRLDLLSIFDLGDTKLFKTATVLPVIVIARKRDSGISAHDHCHFSRIYEYRENGRSKSPQHHCESLLDTVRDRRIRGLVQAREKRFVIERGTLSLTGTDNLWTLMTPQSKAWLDTVGHHTAFCFDALAHVRVGIKTTADDVFIQDWDALRRAQRPEARLLKPMLTHHDAARWLCRQTAGLQKILYPHVVRQGKKHAVELDKFPRAKRFLEAHRARLSRRKYLLDAGRHWYEIWVPHKPDEWAKPKIVCPDISEFPKFFLDRTGAVVNGDCYWITLRPNIDKAWLLLMLGVANSSFITKYYDTLFHNKLYSGRRRFMTQYVKKFPVPHATCKSAQAAIRLVKRMVEHDHVTTRMEEEVDGLVWKAFGFEKQGGRRVQ